MNLKKPKENSRSIYGSGIESKRTPLSSLFSKITDYQLGSDGISFLVAQSGSKVFYSSTLGDIKRVSMKISTSEFKEKLYLSTLDIIKDICIDSNERVIFNQLQSGTFFLDGIDPYFISNNYT